jgi:serine protease Do
VITPGADVKVKVVRAGKEKSLTVKIGVFNPQALAQSVTPTQPEADNPLNIIIEDAGERNGVVVLDILDGPARRAGLRKGDIITMMRNEFVRDKGDFDRIVTDLPENGAVAVRILRGENIVYLAIPTK